MKTNHRRGFKAKTHRDQAMWENSRVSEFADKCVGAGIGNDFTNGNRGMAKEKRGAKKYIRSRIRFAEKQKLRTMIIDD